jgi:excisionase family DNA binding protein
MRPSYAPRLLTRQQAAELLQLSISTISRLLKSGELVAHRLGRQWRIPVESVEAFLNQNIEGAK